jgi:probable rRNA maturation factor
MNPYSIAVANRQSVLSIDRRRLIRLARSVLAREEVAGADISVALVDDPQIHSLNREFLNHDFPTDVISFLLESHVAIREQIAAPRQFKGTGVRSAANRRRSTATRRTRRCGIGKVLGGEIVISAETARRTSADYDTRPQDELALYLVHGLLHLCGYDDRTPREKRLMRRREAEALVDWHADHPSRPQGRRGKKRPPPIVRIGANKTTKKKIERNRG